MPAVPPPPMAFSYSISHQPWVGHEPSKSTPAQSPTCLNCTYLRNVLLSICALAIFSPILMSIKSPGHVVVQPVVEFTTHLLVYAAVYFIIASMAVSYKILRKQSCCTMCPWCCVQAAASVIALQGLCCLHSAALPSSQTAKTVELWAHCVHCVLLQPALWITGGEIDDFPLSKNARVQIWMLCLLCSALLGLGVKFGDITHPKYRLDKAITSTATGRSTPSTDSVENKTSAATAPSVENDTLDTFFLKFEGEIHCISIGSKETTSSVSTSSSVNNGDQCNSGQHRSLSIIEASFISACLLSGFWLCLTVIGTFAPRA